jgi:hypothetical protein
VLIKVNEHLDLQYIVSFIQLYSIMYILYLGIKYNDFSSVRGIKSLLVNKFLWRFACFYTVNMYSTYYFTALMEYTVILLKMKLRKISSARRQSIHRLDKFDYYVNLNLIIFILERPLCCSVHTVKKSHKLGQYLILTLIADSN